jgi:hypothetical protein
VVLNSFSGFRNRQRSKETRIIVATHIPSNLPRLSLPYVEMMRVSNKDIPTSSETVSEIAGLSSHIESWSEYGAYWSAFPWQQNCSRVGLFHYRCALDIEGKSQNYAIRPLAERNVFLNHQLALLRMLPIDTVIVSEPLTFADSTWSQFVSCGEQTRNLESLFTLACKEFDLLIGNIDSESHLKSTNHLFSRNMFVSSFSFAADWWTVSRRIADFMDTRKPIDVDARWAAYILERLFSVYVDVIRSNTSVTCIEKPVVFFE